MLLHDSCHLGLTEPWPQERELTLDHKHTFLTTQVHRGPPRMRDHLNAGATSETSRTWKTIHTSLAPTQSNMANMKGWLWRPSDILGPCGPKAPWHLSYRWGKTPKKTSPRNLVLTGDRTRACCVTGMHAIACSTAVDSASNHVH